MSMRKIAKCLPAIALGMGMSLALSGCMAPVEEPVTVSNSSDTIVTPWGAPSGASRPQTGTADPSATGTMAATAVKNDNLIMMEDANRKALDQIQQKQIDEARIALGILDRMAQRCVQAGDAAACATLQSNWNSLSQQLHKTLSMMAGDTMQMQNSIPADDPAMPAMDESAPAAPMAPAAAPAMDAPANSNAPTMEKTIPMTEPGADG